MPFVGRGGSSFHGLKLKCMKLENGEGWYALNVFFNRVTKLSSLLEEEKMVYYVPMHTVELFKDGEKVYERRQLVTSLLFLRCTASYFTVLKEKFGDSFYVYSEHGSKSPKRIPDKEMNSFMLVTSVEDKGLELLPQSQAVYDVGDHVRVIDGVFRGAEGYVKRIQGRKRLIVSIEGIAVVATSYIPKSFLEIIKD